MRMPDVEATGGIVEIPLAQTGEGIADCELIRWFVKEGDMVDEFAPVCEVQSDKASVVITSRYKGQVSQIRFNPGDIVKVGETLLELMLEGSAASSQGEIHHNSNGDSNPNSEKASIAEPEARLKNVAQESESTPKLASPAVRALAKEYGVDLADIEGSGNDGRITKGDVMSYISLRENALDDIQSMNEAPVHVEGSPSSESSVTTQEYTPVPAGPNYGVFDGGDTSIPVRGYRRAMAKAMTAAAAVPHFYYVEEIGVDKLTKLKRVLSEGVPLEPGVKLTHLPFLIKALSMALKKYPVMNSTVDEAVTEIQVRASHNIGIAMATSHGLVVPNIKNVQRLSVLQIATELSRLIQLANTNSLSTDDITGGTITVSNFGAIGGKFGMPILNVPEVAIVAIGRMQQVVRPSEDYSEFSSEPVVNVTWGADHRVIDGATVAHFCNEWKLLIEQPERLLLTLQ
ncbi:hypothetical protein M758_3G252400 [Ceratodon purpureus]|nr:hypothetical protein M758_3G252400 [Ceratodon purpureus]